MNDFVIPVGIGVLIACGWMLVWAVVLRAWGIPPMHGAPLLGIELSKERREITRQYAREMGKLRYVLFYGVLGRGFAFGLAIAIAEMKPVFSGWGKAGVIFGFVSLIGGTLHGLRMWSQLFREPVPFPPPLSPLK